MSSMTLELGNRILEFVSAPVEFDESRISDLFGRKNNKSMEQTLHHPKYIQLPPDVVRAHPDLLKRQLGEFIARPLIAFHPAETDNRIPAPLAPRFVCRGRAV